MGFGIRKSVYPSLRQKGLTAAWVVLSGIATLSAESNLKVSGYAWTEYKNGLTPMYQGAANFDYNPFFELGGMAFLDGQPSENWSTNLSVGVAYGNSAIKKSLRDTNDILISKTNPNSISLGMYPFIYEAKIAYKAETFGVKLGKFHYTYSDHNHNMGLYLLRGPVYPGFIYSGFNDIPKLTKTGILGSWSPMEALTWDFLASFETDYKPYMDIALSSFVKFSAGPMEIGAGVESQRFIEFNSCITSPSGGADVNECLGGDPSSAYVGPNEDLYKGAFFVIDTSRVAAGGKADTTTYSLAGTKLMLRGAFDFKRILSGYEGSVKDFVIYAEAALLGVKDYPHIYEKKGERIPILFGINAPSYGLLDLLSLEIEYYNAPYQNDPYKLVGSYDVFQFSDGNSINYAMSPIPPSNKAGSAHLSKAQKDFDPSKDNLKWSLFASKKIHDRITFKVQVASDHWRVPNNNFVQYEAAANPGQVYGSMRVDYSL